MYRKITLIVSVALALALAATPAAAITFGEPDGNRHSNVGLLLADRNNDKILDMTCSGTLIAPTVFLTAGHCTRGFALSGLEGWVTFAPEYDPQTSQIVPVAAAVTHPDYDLNPGFNDVGVLILEEPVLGVTPPALPPENLLDQMKAAGALNDQWFVSVGYGATAEFKGAPPVFSRDGIRRFALSPYTALTENWLLLLQNHDATGGGGTCAWDSGAPQFLGDSNLIASVASQGGGQCLSIGMAQRLDTPSVRAFLGNYVTLP